jgi:hypothetical protein
MSKPRPGVAAGKRLSKCVDKEIWRLVETKYSEIISHQDGLEEIDSEYRRLGRSLSKGGLKDSISKEELLSVVSWKFSVGKPRHALMKHLRSNTEDSVREHSAAAIAKARGSAEADTESTKKALQELINLNGVGPATASAILTLVQPDLFAYMYDEVIECFLPKRTYTLSTYMTLNNNCLEIAKTLGDGWTASRVATALWTAARVNAYKLQDHTLPKRPLVDEDATKENKDTKDRRAIKRRKC